jgi:hypothetical protein
MPKSTWITESSDDEKGSFCDTTSQHHYQHGNLTDAVEAETDAHNRGESVVWLDSPSSTADVYEVTPGQGFNSIQLESDSQGNLTPPKHGPGR